jgi:general secretion pathway protein N
MMRFFAARKGVAALLFLAALLVLVAFMPLRFALGMALPDKSAITAKSVSGTIWQGTIADMQMGGLSLGRLDTALRLFPLFIGRAEYHVERIKYRTDGSLDTPSLTGKISGGFGGRGVRDMTGNIPLGDVDPRLPLSHLELRDFAVRFDGSICNSAKGSVRLLLKPGPLSQIGLGSGFLGQATCKGDALLLPLVSQSAMERADIRIKADGSYEIMVSVQNESPEVGLLLASSGFTAISGGYRLTVKGQF